MLKISKLADYATVIMHWLSVHNDDRFSASVVAEQVKISIPTVSKVLKLLSDAELVTPTRGAQGGYHLSRPAEQVSLADIISAVDGRPAMTECSHADNQCQLDHHCELRGNWQYINKVIYNLLDRLSLCDMTSPLCEADVVPMQFHPSKKHVGEKHVQE